MANAENLHMIIVVGLGVAELWWELKILAIFIPSREIVGVGKIKLSIGICEPCKKTNGERDRVEQYHQVGKCECMVGTG